MEERILALILVLASTPIGSVASLYFKKGAKRFKLNIIRLLKNKDLLIGSFLYGASTIVYMYALKLEDVSLLYPLTALSYVWTAILSIRYLDEKMSTPRWMGIFLIILGVFFIVK